MTTDFKNENNLKYKHFVQIEREALQNWAVLAQQNAGASIMLQHLISRMGEQNAVITSIKTLSKITGKSGRTVSRYISYLVDHKWIQRVTIGGTVHGYVINDRVAWGEKRKDIQRTSTFTANVIIDESDQDDQAMSSEKLKNLSIVTPAKN